LVVAVAWPDGAGAARIDDRRELIPQVLNALGMRVLALSSVDGNRAWQS